ncbi:hypothetical protein HK107_08230 [Parvularcula sp. ZS-1/3]|uniref:MAPEG family protein n=1 Tax=Parvularcula mediterranea TaxID=2732508 RepID=A0A7Y3RLI7_9PROT|nr:MAPEG family protein [Parvularcula mediterranea]NNU16306.1 hypothetical protein [Parvularcula mediterranea]
MEAILPPLFIQVALSLVILAGGALMRIVPSLNDKAMAREAAKGRKDVFTPQSKLWIDNLQNQFETPVLFYVAILLAIASRQPISDGFVTLAWVYVIARILHAAVHVTVNIVMVRLLIFLVSFVTLILMWVQLYGQLMGA